MPPQPVSPTTPTTQQQQVNAVSQLNAVSQTLGERAVAHEAEDVVEHRNLVGPDDEGEGAFLSPLRLPQDPWIRLWQRQEAGV